MLRLVSPKKTGIQEYERGYKKMNDFKIDQELITIGITWLSENIENRDVYIVSGKPATDCPAVEYANRQSRVIRRTLDFIESSKGNNQWLHDWLLTQDLQRDVFTLFFKLWSKQYNLTHPKKISRITVLEKDGDWVNRALREIQEK